MKRYVRKVTASIDSKAKWVDYLPSDVYNRLCVCRSSKADLEDLVTAKWAWMRNKGKDKEGFTREDALIAVLELLDSNGQYIDLTQDEYTDLCR